MGLLSSLFGGRSDEAVEDAWYPDTVGVWYPDDLGVCDDNDCATTTTVVGDIQVGDSFSVRLFNDADPEAVVDVTAYAVAYDHSPGEFHAQVQVEWWICGDRTRPGDTEQWSDTRYFDIGSYRDEPTATDHAQVIAEALIDRDGHPQDGLIDYLPEDVLDVIFRWER
jgi:hypothetical protein